MNFIEIAENRQSCRSYDETRPVEQEKLDAILKAAATMSMGMNKFPISVTGNGICPLVVGKHYKI